MDNEGVLEAVAAIRTTAQTVLEISDIGNRNLHIYKLNSMIDDLYANRPTTFGHAKVTMDRFVREFLSNLDGETPEQIRETGNDWIKKKVLLRIGTMGLIAEGNRSPHLMRECKALCSALLLACRLVNNVSPLTRLGRPTRLSLVK